MPALDKADIAEISVWKRRRFGRPAVPARPSGRPVLRRACIAVLTRISRTVGAPSVTWAVPQSASITDDSSGNFDLNL